MTFIKKDNEDGESVYEVETECMATNEHKEFIKNYIQNVARNDNIEYGKRILLELPTKHGYHLITTPFDIQGLLKVYPNKNKHEFIHKDGPTILYVP